MIKKIANILKDFVHRSPRNAGQPYIPHPPVQCPSSQAGQGDIFYQEANTEIENIAGTSINFGTVEKLIVDDEGNTNRISQKQGYILGTGILVTNLNPTVKDGIPLPGVGGACGPCKQEVIELLQANLISLKEAERRSLFDTGSVAQCDACGRRDLCIRHCRPFEKADGSQLPLCPECTKKAQREKGVTIALNFLLSPVIDESKLLPGNTQGDNHDERPV